ncbi:hypothetical protein BC2230_90276 [Burkholderia cepacia]
MVHDAMGLKSTKKVKFRRENRQKFSIS